LNTGSSPARATSGHTTFTATRGRVTFDFASTLAV
jgi:hypothetical protein